MAWVLALHGKAGAGWYGLCCRPFGLSRTGLPQQDAATSHQDGQRTGAVVMS